jgi:hypothetical protein
LQSLSLLTWGTSGWLDELTFAAGLTFLIALAGFEREMILDRFRDRAISGRLAEIALSEADRLIEMTRSAGRTGYRRAARAHAEAREHRVRLGRCGRRRNTHPRQHAPHV